MLDRRWQNLFQTKKESDNNAESASRKEEVVSIIGNSTQNAVFEPSIEEMTLMIHQNYLLLEVDCTTQTSNNKSL